MKTLETKLEIKSWDEKPYRELSDGTKFTRAEVTLAGTGDGLASGEFEALMYYRADGTSGYVTLMSVEGALEGREGRIVLRGEGIYDGTTAEIRYHVVEATGGLAGLTGGGTSRSTHADYPFMPLVLEYDLT